jgi:hypothetical protein
MCSHGCMITLLLHQIKVIVKPSSIDPKTISSLSLAWVKIHGMPDEAKKDYIIKAISEAMGKMMAIDEWSLTREGQVCIFTLISTLV